jgi:hypothetical protein
MYQILIEQLRSYITDNNPDLLLRLQQDLSVTRYLEDKVHAVMPLLTQLLSEDKPQYIIEELCMDQLTRNLRPSKFNYIKDLLEEEFLQSYERFRAMGVLTYEVINIIEACAATFDHIGFTEANEDNKALRYAITGEIEEYLGS